jgi:hypothetical protein
MKNFIQWFIDVWYWWFPKKEIKKRFKPESDIFSWSDDELELYRLTDNHRFKLGLIPLLTEVQHHIGATARTTYGIDNNRKTKFNHAGLKVVREYLQRLGVKDVGENTAYGYGSMKGAFGRIEIKNSKGEVIQKASGWIGSPSHRRNLENPNWKWTGISVQEDSEGRKYYSQIFGK